MDLSNKICSAVADKLRQQAGMLRVFGEGHGYICGLMLPFEGGTCLEVEIGDETYDVTVIVVRR